MKRTILVATLLALAGAPVRALPQSSDRVTQLIQSHAGVVNANAPL